MKRLLFFINPNAGHTEIRNRLMEVLQIFSAGGYDVTVYPTAAPKDLTRKIIENGAEYDLLVCTGGDGTLNEAVSGLMHLPEDKRPPLGYIPGGTVNDVAATLGLSKNVVTAAQDIIGGKPFAMDVGSFCGTKWFVYVAAFGLFTDVSYETSQEDKRAFGRLAYLLEGVRALSDVRAISTCIECEGERKKADVLDGLVCSTTSVGGFRPRGDLEVSLNDGKAEIVLVKDIKNLIDFGNVAGCLLRLELQNDSFISYQSGQAHFHFDAPVSWTLDGEYGGDWQDVDIQIHQQAIRMIIPEK